MSGSLISSSPEAKTVQRCLTRWKVLSLLGLSLGCCAFVQVGSALSQSTGTATEATQQPSLGALTRSTLKPGSRGADVTELQATLKLLGYYSGTVDGVYGQSTVSAVSQFQQAAGLSTDGIAGPATWNRLFPPADGSVPIANSGNSSSSVPAATTSATTLPATTPATSSAPVTADSSAASFPVPSGVSPTPSSKPALTPSPRPAVSPAPSANPAKKPSKPSPDRPASVNLPQKPSSAESVGLPVLRQETKGSAVTALQERLRTIGVFKGAADGVFGAATLAAVKAAQRSFKLEPDGVVGPATWSALLR